MLSASLNKYKNRAIEAAQVIEELIQMAKAFKEDLDKAKKYDKINPNVFLKFFPKKWQKKVNQGTIVGMAVIFFTMLTMFAWIIYFFYKLIY